MDRSLNDATQRIADQLVSLSYEYESGVESRSTPPTFDVLEELALLRMLEPLARKSLPETAQGNPASDVKSAAKKTSPKTAEV